jgi:hypothetical protein
LAGQLQGSEEEEEEVEEEEEEREATLWLRP